MEAQFVTICHMPRTHRVCVYKGIPKIEMEKLLSSVFKTGNRRIVGLMCDQNDVVPLAVRIFHFQEFTLTSLEIHQMHEYSSSLYLVMHTLPSHAHYQAMLHTYVTLVNNIHIHQMHEYSSSLYLVMHILLHTRSHSSYVAHLPNARTRRRCLTILAC